MTRVGITLVYRVHAQFVHPRPVVVLSTSITATAGVLAVLTDAAPTHLGRAALLAGLPEPRRLRQGTES